MSDPDRLKPTERFRDRVDDYSTYRPSYPPQVLALMRDELGLRASHVVADMGSGTGILSHLFLDNGNVVYGVEPNRAMADAAAARLEGYDRYHGVHGSAEATGLESAHVDVIVAGQAFHWFDPDRTRREFRRVLEPGGWVVLIWNRRRTEGTPFLTAYEAFLHRWGTDYRAVSRRYEVAGVLDAFFAPGGYGTRTFENTQRLDLKGLQGRLLSSSYLPGPDHPKRAAMLAAVPALFDAYQHAGVVQIDYDTLVYYGRLHQGPVEPG